MDGLQVLGVLSAVKPHEKFEGLYVMTLVCTAGDGSQFERQLQFRGVDRDTGEQTPMRRRLDDGTLAKLYGKRVAVGVVASTSVGSQWVNYNAHSIQEAKSEPAVRSA